MELIKLFAVSLGIGACMGCRTSHNQVVEASDQCSSLPASPAKVTENLGRVILFTRMPFKIHVPVPASFSNSGSEVRLAVSCGCVTAKAEKYFGEYEVTGFYEPRVAGHDIQEVTLSNSVGESHSARIEAEVVPVVVAEPSEINVVRSASENKWEGEVMLRFASSESASSFILSSSDCAITNKVRVSGDSVKLRILVLNKRNGNESSGYIASEKLGLFIPLKVKFY